jgi:hypothetical protein
MEYKCGVECYNEMYQNHCNLSHLVSLDQEGPVLTIRLIT